jgi:ABC-type lipoprotein release transport system permease subunit
VSLTLLALRSLWYYRRTTAAVVFGLVVATGVITGSLVIGDSVRASLRSVALSRLGRVEFSLRSQGLFRSGLARLLWEDQAVAQSCEEVAAVLSVRGVVRKPEGDVVVPQVNACGVDADFWRLLPPPVPVALRGRQCALNAALAEDLGAKVGDELLLTVYRPSAISLESLFARRSRKDTAPTLRLEVAAVLPAGGVGDFRLDGQSATPRNLFLSHAWLATAMRQGGKANILLACSRKGYQKRALGDLQSALARQFRLQDQGLRLVVDSRSKVISLFSDAVTLTERQVQAAREAAAECGARCAAASVYLADSLTVLKGPPGAARALHYAVIAGTEPLQPFTYRPGGTAARATPGEGWIVLNAWAAQDLQAAPGDRILVRYLAPAPDGSYPVRSAPILQVRGIVELTGPGADPGFAPDFEGITTAKRIQDWDPPFPLDLRQVTQRDEQYWANYRAAPKAFVSLQTVRAMWQSAPGGENADWVTSVRFLAGPGVRPWELYRRLQASLIRRLGPQAAGMVFVPVRDQVLAAAWGTSDFSSLFLGLSMFLVASAVGLAGMLLRLCVDSRAAQAGLMLACGCTGRQVRGVLLREGLLLTVLGTAVGVPAGVGYAAILVRLLRHWWAGALGDLPGLWLAVTPQAVGGGAVCGVAIGLLTAIATIRQLTRRHVVELLAGWQGLQFVSALRQPVAASALAALCLLLALVLAVAAVGFEAVSATAAFFGIGAALLAGGLLALRVGMHRILRRELRGDIGALALRNTAAAGGRSLLVMGLLAAATFVLVAVGANTRDLSRIDPSRRPSGTGGFSLVATASVPLPYDPNTATGRASLGMTAEDEREMAGVEILSLLVSPGEDISCLNLARPATPRFVGVSEALVRRGGFEVIPAEGVPPEQAFSLLSRRKGNAVPVIGDADSVTWTLHSGLGKRLQVTGPDGRPLELWIAGVIPRSIFAGELLLSEAEFRRLYPGVKAPAYLLIDTPPGREQAVARALRRGLADWGVEVRTTREVLNSFLRVQNTYLMMFLALGGLGLVLGTVGMVVVLLRGALERRRELALLQAVGFSRGQLTFLLLLENTGLLMTGLVGGTVSALIAVAPQLLSPEAAVNWGALAGVLGAVLLVGVIGSVAATLSALRGPLLESLRHE